MAVTKITGIIAGASSVERYEKKDGTESKSAVLHVMEICNDAHPMEVAVKVTGDNTTFAGCVGMTVEVEYINRVFAFESKKTGGKTFGNDVYARTIKIINADRSAMLDVKQKEA